MIPASSAQREPSMEEILASIRRIIEDNDSGKKPEEGEGFRLDADVTPDSTIVDVDAFRAELRTQSIDAVEPKQSRVDASPSRPPVAETAVSKPVTLAEVQAQIAAGTRSSSAWSGEAAALPQRPDVSPVPSATPAAAPKVVENTVSQPAPAPKASVMDEKTEFGSVPATRANLPEAPGAKPAIVSELTERKVVAAFGELSEAFAARSQKTFDEMAEKMIRPMLQDWLDNNLPVLVERLVREEIERVARGA